VSDFPSLESNILNSLNEIVTSANAATKAAHDQQDQTVSVRVNENLFANNAEQVEPDHFDLVEAAIAKVNEINAVKKMLSSVKFSRKNEKSAGASSEIQIFDRSEFVLRADEEGSDVFNAMSTSSFASPFDFFPHSTNEGTFQVHNWWECGQIQTAPDEHNRDSIDEGSDSDIEWDE
jgi:hypothetical protein